MIESVSVATDKKRHEVLNGEVTITEKLDTFRFIFTNTNEGVKFYKKNYTEIGLIERTLTNIWEDAIYDINEMCKNVDIPIGLQFGISYTPVDRPLRIPYPYLPKYILTDVKKGNKKMSDEFVLEWANTLGIGKPPIIFKGVLDELQKSILISYDNKDFDTIKDVEFCNVLKNVIGESYSNGDILEGIVISNGKTSLQIESHEFGLLKESYSKVQSNRTLYEMVMLYLSNFLNENDIIDGIGEHAYIENVCYLFNNFIKKVNIGSCVTESDLTPTHYGYMGGLNKTWISNEATLAYLDNGINENIFKIILNGLRVERKPSGILNENVISVINGYVSKLNKTCFGNNDTTYLNEVDNNVVVDMVGEQRELDDLGNMKIIASIQQAFIGKLGGGATKGGENVIVFVSNFSPFSVSEYVLIEQLYNTYNIPIILCHYNTSNTISSDDKYVTSDNLVNAQMKSLVDNIPFIISYVDIDDDSIETIFNKVRPTYEPLFLCTTNDSASDYINQLYFYEKVNGGKIGVMDNFNISNQPKGDELFIMQCIENEDAIKFKELTPKCIHWIWNNILNEYKIWLGCLIK